MDQLVPNKVMVLIGPRRVGKTLLLNQIIEKVNEPHLLLNGEDFAVIELLQRRSVQNYQNVLQGRNLLIIDEAQKVPNIGATLKRIAYQIGGEVSL